MWGKPVPKLASGCIHCGSRRIIKIGPRHNRTGNVQRYRCKKCGRTFTRMKVTAVILVQIMKWHFSGASQRQIVQHLMPSRGIAVSQTRIGSMIRKYTEKMKGYAHSLRLDPIRTLGLQSAGNYQWLWNLLDHDARVALGWLILVRPRLRAHGTRHRHRHYVDWKGGRYYWDGPQKSQGERKRLVEWLEKEYWHQNLSRNDTVSGRPRSWPRAR